MAEPEFDWPGYLADFHTERAGAAEAVLSRALAGDHSPYRWLARAVSTGADRVLDLACGSGAISRELVRPGRTVVGLDTSAAELALAAERGPGPWLRADAHALPFADGSVDAVTSSMGLVVIRPLGEVLSEVARVLKPGGVLAAIAPAVRPLGAADIRLLSRLTTVLRAKPQFPGPVELTGFAKTLQAYGLQKVEDARQRYSFTVAGRADAELLLAALYLPQTRRSRIEAAVEFLEQRVAERGPVQLAIPMRRLVAIK